MRTEKRLDGGEQRLVLRARDRGHSCEDRATDAGGRSKKATSGRERPALARTHHRDT
jgi:hypothetical protein